MMTIRLRTGLVLVAFAASGLDGSAQVAPTGGALAESRTGMIVGQVVDATTRAPVPEAIVQINLPRARPGSDRPSGRVMADDDGRFFFADLPAGDYYLEASAPGFIAGSYGQQQPLGQSMPLPLGDGERRSAVTLHVWKYAAIAGTVVDEAGEPIVGVAVRALARTVIAGRVQFGTTQVRDDLVPTAITDDRGAFRLPQLLPGEYAIAVPVTANTVPAEILDSLDYAARAEMDFAGVHEVSPRGRPGTLQIGDVALVTSSRTLVPPATPPGGRPSTYRTTYYPGVTTAADATTIAVRPGDERTGITITMRPSPAVRVSGRLVTPDGAAPPPMALFLSGEASKDLITRRPPGDTNFDTAVAMSDASGRFTMLGVPPGEYRLEQANPFLNRALTSGVPTYWISQPLIVGTADMDDVVVEVRAPLRLEGREEFRSSRGQGPPSGIAVVIFETPFGEPGQVAAEVQRDGSGTFSTLAAGGRYFVRPYEPPGWAVQSVTIDGRDYTDRAFDLREDATSIAIVFTDRLSGIAGTVMDAQGRPSAAAMVLAFPVDRDRWTGYGLSPRDVRGVPTSPEGRYTIPHLPPGDYYVIAIPHDESGTWQDPKTLDALASRATMTTIRAGDVVRTIDLRVSEIR